MPDDEKVETKKVTGAPEKLTKEAESTTANPVTKVAEPPKPKPRSPTNLLVELMVSPLTCLCTCWHRGLILRAALCNGCGRRICVECLVPRTIQNNVGEISDVEVAYCCTCDETECARVVKERSKLTPASTKS
jgi:hypothetical protein